MLEDLWGLSTTFSSPNSHEDSGWVTRFAERLEGEGFKVARDEVVLKPGDVLVHAIEQAIRDSARGILVFSPASAVSGWVQQEYAALYQLRRS